MLPLKRKYSTEHKINRLRLYTITNILRAAITPIEI